MQGLADEAQLDADAAGRVYLAAAHGDGATALLDARRRSARATTSSPGSAASPASQQIAGDADKLLAIAEQRAEDAEAAQERADAAWAAVDEVPVEALEAEVANAEQALEDARQDLADAQADVSAQSRLASSSVSLIATLPADAGQLSDQGWALPVAGRITDGFGPRPVQAARRRQRVPPRHRPRGHLRDAGVRRDRRRRRRGRARTAASATGS